MTRTRPPVRLLAATLALAACHGSDPAPNACTGQAEPAVVVELTDAVTGAPVAGATVTLSEGAFVETMFEGPPGTYQGGLERPGLYQVDVRADGYAPERREGVRAWEALCGPVTQTLHIALRPEGGTPAIWMAEVEVDERTIWTFVWIREAGAPTPFR